MDLDNVLRIAAKVKYREGWGIDAGEVEDSIYSPLHDEQGRDRRPRKLILIRSVFGRTDTVTGKFGIGKGRALLIEPNDTHEQVVMAIFRAHLSNEEHEARERFEFDGRTVMKPHGLLDDYDTYKGEWKE